MKLEETPFNGLMDFLAESGFLLAKSELGFINQQYLQQFDCLVIGNVFESYLEIEEIDNIVKFVKEGGGLLLISDQGGDYDNRNNISDLASQFGIYFNADHIYDPVNYVDKTDFIVVTDFRPHFITQGINKIVHSSGCSITISEEQTSADTVVDGVAYASDSCHHKSYNGIDWIDEPYPNALIVAVAKHFKGKVAAIGNLSIFSSLGASYGLKVEDNKILVGNILSWLLNQTPVSGESTEHQMLVSVNLEESNYSWAMEQIMQRNWPNISMMLNFALRTLRSATQEKAKSRSKAAAPPAEITSPLPPQTETAKEDEKSEKKVSIEKEKTESKEDKTPEKVPPAVEPAKPKPAKKFVRKPIKKPAQPPASKPRRNPLS